MTMTHASRRPPHPRHAFTLVELLVAIAIIGILMGIAIPAISAALRSARESAIRSEVEVMKQAIEAYKLKYGDYPPDFFDWNVAVRHYRKIFPDISLNELTVLRQLCWDTADGAMPTDHGHDPTRIDRAEALVWHLAGFSSDPKRPFTGAGGPLQLKPSITSPTAAQLADAASYAYNGSRDNALMDFAPELLSMSEYNVTLETAVSFDDSPGDLFPVYRREADAAPYLYFDSRTYGAQYTNPHDSTRRFINVFQSATNSDWGGVRPYLSDQVVAPSEGVVQKAGGGALQFMDKNTFQVISAGLDNSFGTNVFDPTNTTQPVYFAFPSGQAYRIDGSTTPLPTAHETMAAKYGETSAGSIDDHHLDNFTSFAQGRLDSDLP